MNISDIAKISLTLALFALAMDSCQGYPSRVRSAVSLTDGQETVLWDRAEEAAELNKKLGKRDEGVKIRISREFPDSRHEVIKRRSRQFETDKMAVPARPWLSTKELSPEGTQKGY